ncbi:MAG: S-layer homology domain-containing protein [Oscillospiraceae bacterium]|nr:S-layer homology domain-containing protein [Oscillospiraceae bacterium]
MTTRLIRIFLCLCLLLSLPVSTVLAAEADANTPATTDAIDEIIAASPVLTTNMGAHDYINSERWTDPSRSALMYDEASQTYTRVEYTGSYVAVETYDASFQYVSRLTIAMELPIYGGFHEGESYNFLIFGQENPEEDDSVEVIRVVKYDKSWNRLGQASLCGANTTIPFDAGGMSTAEYNGYLYIRTSHEMYADENGTNHQANLTMNVRISDMVVTDSYYDAMNRNYGYVSHSFNQYIRVDESTGELVAVDHGDASPRSIVLTRYYAPAGQDSFMTAKKVPLESGAYTYAYADSVDVLSILGESGDNDTGVSLGGFEISDTAYLTVGTTVSQYATSYDPSIQRSVFLAVTDKETLTTEVTYVTGYGNALYPTNPQLVKISDNKFMLQWSYSSHNSNKYDCVFIDGNGQYLAEWNSISSANCETLLSDCQPIVADGKVVWYMTASSKPVFCTVDVEDPYTFSETHLFDYGVGVYPTESREGTLYAECYICEGVWTSTMPVLGSDAYTLFSSTAPTCESDGVDAYLWTTPHGDLVTFYIKTDAYGHDYSDWTLPEDAACGDYVDYYRTCSRCNNVETNRAFRNHNLELVIIEPTCTERGYTNQVCSRCGYTRMLESSYASPTGHDWTNWTQLEAPSCIDKGLMGRSCTVCGISETSEIGYNDHDYVVTESVDVGCTHDGYEIYTCTVCGDSHKTTTLTAMGHWWDTERFEDGILWTCTGCGYSEMKYFNGDTVVIDPGDEAVPSEPDEPDVPDEPDGISFTDVAEGAYYYDAVLWAVEEGITEGYGSATTFCPDLPCTRAQVVTFLWRAAGKPAPESSVNPFTDVPGGSWYTEAVLWAVEEDITKGYGSETTFCPDRECTRAEIVTFLHRYANTPAPSSGDNPFVDVSSGSWYRDAVLWAVEAEITNGYGSATTFCPDVICSRGQIVTFLYRAREMFEI